MPLAGDRRYSDRVSLKQWRERGLRRIFLHAHRLVLETPDGRELEFHAPLPGSLRQVLDTLEGAVPG